MSSANYAPIYQFFGDVRASDAPANDASLVRKQDVSGLSFISSIAAGSQSLISVSGGALSVESLLITDVTVDTTHNTLAAWISAGIPASMKTGDILVLSAPDPALTYICKVASPSQASDFAQINEHSTYSAGNGITLTGSTFAADAAWLRTNGNVFTAGTGISNSAGTLAIDMVAGNGLNLSGNTYSADVGWLKSDGNVFTAGTGISNSAGTLAIDMAAGNGLSLSGNTYSADVGWLRTDGNVFTAGTGITNSTGTLAVSLSGGNGITVSGAAISADVAWLQTAGNVFSAGTGVSIGAGGALNLNTAAIRYEASNQSLTAGNAVTITHNLGKKVCQVAIMRTSDSKAVDMEIVYSSTSALTVKSDVNETVDIVVSI